MLEAREWDLAPELKRIQNKLYILVEAPKANLSDIELRWDIL